MATSCKHRYLWLDPPEIAEAYFSKLYLGFHRDWLDRQESRLSIYYRHKKVFSFIEIKKWLYLLKAQKLLFFIKVRWVLNSSKRRQ